MIQPAFDFAGVAPTSRDAYREIEPRLTRLQTMVFNHISLFGDYGVTNAEIAVELDMRLSTVCGRRNELVKSGHVRITKRRRDGGAVVVAC